MVFYFNVNHFKNLQAKDEAVRHKEIATKLFLSVYTIDTHRKNICAKLNLENPGALVRYAMEHDW